MLLWYLIKCYNEHTQEKGALPVYIFAVKSDCDRKWDNYNYENFDFKKQISDKCNSAE